MIENHWSDKGFIVVAQALQGGREGKQSQEHLCLQLFLSQDRVSLTILDGLR